MKLQELLSSTTAESAKYIGQIFSLRSSSDYRSLKKLFEQNRFEAKSFEDSILDALTFDWQSLERDRNWWWQLQAMPFLNWYINSFHLQTEEERFRYFSHCLQAIHCWIKNAKQNKNSPLAWHDHATAFRVRNLSNWLAFCHFAGLKISEENLAQPLAELIIEHLDWLEIDKNYSKHTNHGFDQAMIVLTVSLIYAHDEFKRFRLISRERLKGEIYFAFTREGVHKENSPGYQKMMLGRLRQLLVLSCLGEQDISELGGGYIRKAEEFLRAITLPNGCLPMIGDTRSQDEGLAYEQKEKVDVLDYSASGYFIVRGVDALGKDFFILLKSAHESNYHRHDDDMMIFVYYDGEVVFGDGGLYKYDESDEKRKFFRSIWAHSVPFVDHKAIRQREHLKKTPILARVGELAFEMESTMFGVQLIRTVEVSIIPSLNLKIFDRGSCDEVVGANFYLEKKVPLSVGVGHLNLQFSQFQVDFFYEGESFSCYEGWSDELKSIGAIVSKEYGVTSNAMRFVVASAEKSIRFQCF
ncbi:MAG: hypothetical protein E2579_06545 [Pseudomonas sp.]|nr:heparinase II/III family protein [Pseudomonas sp.]MPT17403.1 hypothetical protein [Pseudomonas sp.]